MIMILFKSLRKRTSTGSYYDEKSLTKCYWDGVKWLFAQAKSHLTPSPLVPPSLLVSSAVRVLPRHYPSVQELHFLR